MSEMPVSRDVERFREAIAQGLGLQFDTAKLGSLAEVLQRRLDVASQSAEAYLAVLESTSPADELAALAQELTINETYFFRNFDQFRAFRDTVLRDRMAANAATKRLRILSAGCASGEEAYSIAMLTLDAVDASWDVQILGVDVNPAVVRKAARARYTAWSLRDTPDDVRRRWFRPDGRDFVLVPTVRQAVRFEQRNITHADPRVWPIEAYDVVFLRNVFMYFTPEHQRTVIARAAAALRAGGYLFLGHAETLRGLSTEFHLCHTHETFYYQRKEQLAAGHDAAAGLPPAQALEPAVVADVENSESWVEAIRRASARIEILSRPARPPASSSRQAVRQPVRSWSLERALALLREERLSEALEMMQQLPASEAESDPDALLLVAALLTHKGQLTDAEDACHRLLAVDELSAGAHYLLALCREGAHDRDGAINHDRVAVYLDPAFAMPHLHLGLLARRAGDLRTAQGELSQALQLFPREDSSRVLLFGGGFGREALIALCRTELGACGGRA